MVNHMAVGAPTLKRVVVTTAVAMAVGSPLAVLGAEPAVLGAEPAVLGAEPAVLGAEAETEARESGAETTVSARQPVTPNTRVVATEPSGSMVNPYTGFSNEQLAGLADAWVELDRDERRWFFVEVRKRLTANGSAPEIPIRSSARFGQIVRNRDGTVVRIEAVRVTEQRRRQPSAREARRDPRAYGLGFERRRQVLGSPQAPTMRPRPASATVSKPAAAPDAASPPQGGI